MTSLSASAFQDERSRISLLPTAVKLTCGRVYGASLLLHDAPTQAVLGYTGGCRLENVCGGEKAGLLLDYGRESHGTLRLTAASVESASGRAKLRIRFGESVMEALTSLGQKNATNDHAVRDHVYDLGTLSTAETNESGFRFAYLELEAEDADRLSGWVQFHAERIPHVGQQIEADGCRATVLKRRHRRVTHVRLEVLSRPSEVDEAEIIADTDEAVERTEEDS